MTGTNLLAVLASASSGELNPTYPLIILAIGIATVIGMIVILRIHAFLALITAAIVVSLLAPGELAVRISRVAVAFGTTAGKIGIVIALAAVIGRCLIDSGAADRVVRMFMRLFGEKRAPVSLMTSGFVLSVPVFFDTVFYLLMPLARSMHRRTRQQYLLLILAMGAGASITHSLVPPTPGPLYIASDMGIDVGMMILIGLAVAIPTAIVILFFIRLLTRIIDIPMRPIEGAGPEPEPLPDDKLPGLFVSMLPIVLPVLLISLNTVMTTLADAEHAARFRSGDVVSWPSFSAELIRRNDDKDPVAVHFMSQLPEEAQAAVRQAAQATAIDPNTEAILLAQWNRSINQKNLYQETVFAEMTLPTQAEKLWNKGLAGATSANVEHFNRLILESVYPEYITPHTWQTSRRRATSVTRLLGDPNLALLASAVIALFVLWRQRRPSRVELGKIIESALMSGGIIILITSAGGAFGAMLQKAQIGEAIQSLFTSTGSPEAQGLGLIFLAFFIAFLLKFAQGSSTVSMMTTSGIMVAMIANMQLGFHPVYLAAAIGFGAQCGNWMNDSGFWIFAKMGGLTEVETLKTWTVTVSSMAVIGLLFTALLAKVLPLV